MITLVEDKYGFKIQAFVPRSGALIEAGDYIPATDEIIMLGNVTDITIDNVLVQYPSGTIVTLIKGKPYEFATATAVHKM